jgi:hypothetical protein
MGFTIDEPSGTRDRDVIRRPLVQSDGQELPQRERIGETPRDGTLAIKSSNNPIIITRKYWPGGGDGRPSFL